MDWSRPHAGGGGLGFGREASSRIAGARARVRAAARGRVVCSVAALFAAVALAAGLLLGRAHGTPAPPPPASPAVAAASGTATFTTTTPSPPVLPKRANVVFILTDDLSLDLLPYMPEVQALQARGMTFKNYFVSDSLCCPSRTSIFTGDFPHDSGVYGNVGPDGGVRAFFHHGDENRTFNLALEAAGYQTALMGKYLNGYLEPRQSPVSDTYVPPGWDEWDVAGDAYPEFNYLLNQNGRLHHYGHRPEDYLTNVLARKADGFIRLAASKRSPFFLEVATFAPHRPYTPAPEYDNAFSGLTAPEPPNFDTLPLNPPRWLSGHPPLTPQQITGIDTAFRKRVESVQSVDNLIVSVEHALAAHGMIRNTYIVFSSDNGLHTGEYRLTPGKLTAYDTDIHVPLVIAGPGVPAGASTSAMTENVDLADTFADIGHTPFTSDGHSLMTLLSGATPDDWRTAVLIEHHGPVSSSLDPDQQDTASGNPTTYEAMRTPEFLYVEYADGEREFYDLTDDPYELDNVAGQLSADQLEKLHTELLGLETCHGAASCWAAGHVPPLAPSGIAPLRRHRSRARRRSARAP